MYFLLLCINIIWIIIYCPSYSVINFVSAFIWPMGKLSFLLLHFCLVRHTGHLRAATSSHRDGGGGGPASATFNRDALTNRWRIRLLDKASFILTLRIPQRLHWVGEKHFGGERRWHTVPVCALFDHAWAVCIHKSMFWGHKIDRMNPLTLIMCPNHNQCLSTCIYLKTF